MTHKDISNYGYPARVPTNRPSKLSQETFTPYVGVAFNRYIQIYTDLKPDLESDSITKKLARLETD